MKKLQFFETFAIAYLRKALTFEVICPYLSISVYLCPHLAAQVASHTDMEPFSATCPCFPQVSGRQNLQKTIGFLRCLSDRLHIDVTVFPSRKTTYAEGRWFSSRFLGSAGGVGDGENSSITKPHSLTLHDKHGLADLLLCVHTP